MGSSENQTRKSSDPSRALKLTSLQTNFEKAADAIMDEYDRRRPLRGYAPFENANGYLKRMAYVLIKKTISKKGSLNIMRGIVKKYSKLYVSEFDRKNQFYIVLLAMDPHLEKLGDRRTLSLYARQLLFAHRNAVPAEYLIGFLYQSASQKRLLERLAVRRRDPSLSLGESQEVI